jgi:hypothetical protein
MTTPEPRFGQLLNTLRLADLEKPADGFKETAVIRDPVTVASFNWMCANQPTIVIPGRPYMLVTNTSS